MFISMLNFFKIWLSFPKIALDQVLKSPTKRVHQNFHRINRIIPPDDIYFPNVFRNQMGFVQTQSYGVQTDRYEQGKVHVSWGWHARWDACGLLVY